MCMIEENLINPKKYGCCFNHWLVHKKSESHHLSAHYSTKHMKMKALHLISVDSLPLKCSSHLFVCYKLLLFSFFIMEFLSYFILHLKQILFCTLTQSFTQYAILPPWMYDLTIRLNFGKDFHDLGKPIFLKLNRASLSN